jgi:transposase InsO family protein
MMPVVSYVGVKVASFLPARNMCHLISCRPYPLAALFSTWGLDLVGPFKKAKGGFTHIFITVDKFTKWVEVKPTTSITTAKAVEFVKEIMYGFGVPNNIITDNGTQFTVREFKDFFANSSIKINYASVSHPQSNGQVER